MKIIPIIAAATAALALAGCDSLSESQKTLRDSGRPYQIGEANGLKAYRWDIPRGSYTTTLYFVVDEDGPVHTTTHCNGDECVSASNAIAGEPK